MAAACGPENPPLVVSELAVMLRTHPWNFEFFQAVRLLERLHRDLAPVGHFSVPSSEAVRFRAHASTVFPASEIQSLRDSEGAQADMEVNFMGLFGPQGVLPLYYTEMIAERARVRDTALIDFLNIFNHRMISLFYRAWEKYRFLITYERGGRDQVGRRLLDFIGLGTPGLQDRQQVPDDALIYYSGLLSQQPRCAANLESLIADYFDAPVEVEQFVGAWYKLDESTQFCMDDGADVSEQLGVGAVVGDEVWDTQGRVRLRIGPLRMSRYLDFLPSGSAYRPLRAIAQFYAEGEIDFEVQLILDRRDVPVCELGAEGETAPRLGWLTWAKTKPMGRDPGETILPL
ncbi:MAG TPA: type VI secretion system baseplate subunit TssG [Bryobacteraceae bacterium]|nr:type VI secretion system baseplate subunit TssG [Bryobacteraceae bacterium]